MPDSPEQDRAQGQAPDRQPGDEGWLLGGRYRVLDRLGLGGMAEVFRAHDELLDRDVAVKVFRTGVAGDDDTHGAVRRELELQSLARLSHPNLITLFDGSVAGDGPAYLVLELVNGPDLASRLREGPLSEPETREIGGQIADALGYVHARGMVHRDVKPANILLGVDDALPGSVRARLSDFGIVRMIGSERMTSVDMTLGTASYVAPEQAKGENVGPAADVYSLALVLIESLTGVRCFDGPVHEALAARLVRAPQIPPGLPAPWPELLAAMTVQDPDDRPDAAEVARSLREGVAPTVAPVGDVPADMSPTTANATVAAAGLVAAGAVGAAVGPVTPAAAAVPSGAAAALSTGAVAAAPTGPLAPVSTGAVPVAAMNGLEGPPPPATYAPWSDEPYEGDAHRGRRGAVLALAALAFAALVAGAGFLLLGGSPDTPAGGSNVSTTQPVTPSKSTTAKHPRTSQAAEVAATTSRSSSTSRSASRTATTTSSAPHTSRAPQTSTAPRTSTSAAQTTTSSAPSPSSLPPTTAPGSAVAAGGVGTPPPGP